MDVTFPPTEKAKYFLELPNGNAAAVFTGKNWNGLVERTAWFSGAFDGDKFRATRSGHAVIPDPIVEPIFPWSNGGVTGGGLNVGLNDSTDGAVVAGGAGSAAAAQGAGMLRD